MIKLTFTLQEMISALERIGYTVKNETEIEIVNYYNTDQEVERNVYNLYYKGQIITDQLFPHWFGTKRLEWVFEREVQKRILQLF
jgi:hypothetical protein